jgi:hypothetical protein
MRAFIVFWQPHSHSVIEEKGEGFENGKTNSWLLGFAFNLSPPYYIVRITIQATIKTLLNEKNIQTQTGFINL